jgi:hypothetical protein
VLGVRRWRELATDRKKTGQSPEWAVVLTEEEEESVGRI